MRGTKYFVTGLLSAHAVLCGNYYRYAVLGCLVTVIIESVDSVSRDGLDTTIYIIHYTMRSNLEEVECLSLSLCSLDLRQNTFLSSPRSFIKTVKYA